MTEQNLELYRLRREAAELQVGRQAAHAFGIKHTEQMNWQQVHEALIDKREAWQNDSAKGDARFEKRRLHLLERFGKQTPFHDAFDGEFRQQLVASPLHEVASYLTELTATHVELLDVVGCDYLLDIVRSSSTPASTNNRRALQVLIQLRTKALRSAERMKRHAVLASIRPEEGPCLPPLTLAIADEIAEATGLTQEGEYVLGPKKKSALVAFHQALSQAGLVRGTKKNLNEFFGQRYKVEVKVDGYSSKTIGQDYLSLVGKQIKERGLRPTKSDK
jgi:hypothetical protein